MSTSMKTDHNALIREAAGAVGSVMATSTYALVGGAGCVLLGSDRVTQDIDIVVPKGMTIESRKKFRDSDKFVVEPKSAHTYYKTIEIEILTPPTLFRDNFDSKTPVVQVDGVNVLKPSLILNAKCKSILGRADNAKKATDAADIIFLLKYLAANNVRLAPIEIPNISKEFVEYFIGLYQNEDKWFQAGYNIQTGTF